MKSYTELLMRVSELEKQNHELKLYLNQIQNYKIHLEKKLRGIRTPFSILYQTWKLYKKFTQLAYYPIKKTHESKLWDEINTFSKIRNSKNLDIFNFGVIPYTYRHLRQQHLVEQLAKKGHRIFYIENYFIPIEKEKDYGLFRIRKHKQNIYIVTLSATRNIYIYFQEAKKEEIQSIATSINNLIKKAAIKNAVAKIDHPFWAYILPYIKIPIIYDCMEDYEGFDITENHILELEKVLFKNSDLVLVCSNLLKEKFKKYLPKNTLFLKNAGEYEHFEKAIHKTYVTPNELTKLSRPIIGYFGAIGELIDTSLLKRLAEHYKKYSIVLIGELRNQEVMNLPNTHPNIYTLGEKPYFMLPSYLQEFNVCIIPFVVNKSTKLIDPVKLYEYLASGKPVVATDISEIYGFRDVCYISKNSQEFIANVEKALTERGKNLTEKRRRVAKENTWETRGNVLNSAIQILVKRYNNYHVLKH